MEWISVDERLPEDEGDVLAMVNNPHLPHFGSWREVVLYQGGSCWNCGHATVTHWMPLPECPKDED
jgi:hypothetical protein